ncbi:putative Ser/Thr protein kinase [Bradyrhizobium sp. JR6.1]
MYNDSLFNAFARSFEARSQTDMSMAEYLESCRSDPMRYANAAERLLAAIGEPQMIDTAKDPRLGRIFLNRTIRSYPAFAGFFGMEDTIERLVGFFRHAAQGLERAQADPLFARTGRRRQVVARRAHQGADGDSSDLRAEGG